MTAYVLALVNSEARRGLIKSAALVCRQLAVTADMTADAHSPRIYSARVYSSIYSARVYSSIYSAHVSPRIYSAHIYSRILCIPDRAACVRIASHRVRIWAPRVLRLPAHISADAFRSAHQSHRGPDRVRFTEPKHASCTGQVSSNAIQ